ncbi:peptidoglycan-binding protein [Bacillus marinisedimentorum]|uniref:peptidoglycan-binding protein n=1 Tax=Bacillus marinisedimentorum TaxID=1821260 RepID=UPI000871D4F4|nr:peptidoglycan-binding protein [Bacillus marinisedimentorum]
MSCQYDAFGNLFTQMAAPYNANGFTGKAYDAKAGLMDYGARWYSPNTARFMSPDTFSGWQDQPLSLNRYSYTYNNPVNFIDPTGRMVEHPGGGSSGWTGQTLERGDSGPYVEDLQAMLQGAGFSPGGIDGIFGQKTENAVINFQQAADIAVDGIAGPQTYNALLTYGKSSGGSNGGGSGGNEKIGTWMGELLRKGDRGSMVEDLQRMLSDAGFSYISIDGVFGNETESVVKQFQRSKGLKKDGLAGIQTYSALKGNNWSRPKEKEKSTSSTIRMGPHGVDFPYYEKIASEQGIDQVPHEIRDVIQSEMTGNAKEDLVGEMILAIPGGGVGGVIARGGIKIGGRIGSKVLRGLGKKGTSKTVDDLIKNATPGRATKGRTSQYDLSGGFDKAVKDFESLQPNITKNTPDLRVGKLPDGRTVIVRKKSSDGRPTIEIQDGKKKIKFRY